MQHFHQNFLILEKLVSAHANRADFWPTITLNYLDLGEIHASPSDLEKAVKWPQAEKCEIYDSPWQRLTRNMCIKCWCGIWILKSWLAILNPQSSTFHFEVSILYSPYYYQILCPWVHGCLSKLLLGLLMSVKLLFFMSCLMLRNLTPPFCRYFLCHLS